MRISLVCALPLLAGCASATAEPAQGRAPERAPVITRIVRADTPRIATIGAAKAAVAEIRPVDAACQTGDRMPTSHPHVGTLAPMPSARPGGALPYIPNACPVTAAPGQRPPSPAVLQRGSKRVRQPGERP